MKKSLSSTSTDHAILLSDTTQQRITATLFTAHGLMIAANVASFTLMPVIATQLAGESAAGVPSTISMVGRAAGGYLAGWLMAQFGRRFGLSMGYLAAALGALLSVFAIGWASFFAFCVGMGLQGAGRATSEQARFVAAEVVEPERRAKVIGFIVAAGIVGGVFGPLVVDPSERLMRIFDMIPATGPYLLSTGLTLLAFLLILFLLYPDPAKISRAIDERFPTQDSHPKRQPGVSRSFRQIMAVPSVQVAMASLIIGQLVMTWLMVIMAVHMANNSHTTWAISWTIALHNAGMYAFSWSVGWVVERFGQIATIVAGSAILALSTIMSPLSVGFPVLASAMFLVGLGWSFTFVAGSAMLSDALSPDERSHIQGASESLVAIGGGLGSLGTGVLYAIGGMTIVSVIGLLFSLALFAAVSWYILSQRTRVVTGV
ncbi:MFS transporter [Chloroflexi bacterium TSY]|nr:MFS transporter [Chloroflexi bacterium TSY]